MRRFSVFFTRLAASLVAGGCASLLLAPVFATNARAAGMPQMDFKNPLIMGQFFWVLIIFFCLFLVVKYFSIPQVENVISYRRSKIDQDLNSARQAKAQADKAVAALNKTRHDAALEAQRHVDAILQETKADSAKKMQELQGKLDQEMKITEKRIIEARNKALTQVDQMSKEVAYLLVKKMLNEEIDSGVIDQKIRQFVPSSSH